MSIVSIVKCEDYAKADAAVRKAAELIGGMKKIVKKDDTVLLKPNVLMPKPPEAAVTTHPEIIRTMINLVKEAGGIPVIGDGCGSAYSTSTAFKASGIEEIANENGVELINFEKSGMYKLDNPNGEILKSVIVAKPVIDADVIISLPKLKTHMLTIYTGAVKNFYGAIPSTMKRHTHYTATSSEKFSEAVVDIYSMIKPDMAIMDGILGMEGSGPSAGKPIKSNLIAAGYDCVSVDAVCSAIIEFEPLKIHTTRIASSRGLGEGRLENIEIVGESIKNVKIRFKKPAGYYKIINYIPQSVACTAKVIIPKRMPFILEDKCIKCHACEKACPVQAILIGEKGKISKIDRRKCVLCYCCHEMCPNKAIALKSRLPILQR
ncbi:MAG: DUF362 domain-containing protein [Thermoplasmata archaeon]